MQSRDLRQHLLQVHLRLLRLLPQNLDRPLLALAKKRKKRIEQLVAGHARHALVLAFWRLGLCALKKREKTMRPGIKSCGSAKTKTKKPLSTHRKVGETSRRRNATAEHLPAAVPSPRPVHQPDAHRPVIRSRAALHETPLISPRHARPQIALVLHLPRHDRGAGPPRPRRGLRALRNDDLVVHVLIDHVQFVYVLVATAIL
jgi:hypothetical protein